MALGKESARIQEDAQFSAKGHYNAAARLKSYNYIMGTTVAILTAVSGVISYNDYPLYAAVLAVLCAAFTGILTCLQLSERAQQHKSAAGDYHSLEGQARFFKEIEIPSSGDFVKLKRKLEKMLMERDRLNRLSLVIPREPYKKARKDIEAGRGIHKIDNEFANEP